MSATKPKSSKQLPRSLQTVRILLRPQNRGLVLAAVVLAAGIGGLHYAWQRWGEPSTRSPEYVVTAGQIFVTPPPEWIHADVKAEVVRAADLDGLDLRQQKLVGDVAAAFALHPWVAKVVRVEKRFPARVDVRLEYRRPVAAVEITARNQPGLLFIDEESVLLPSADFAEGQAKEFLRIAGGTETPAGVYGTAWGSERIAGAARVAAAWESGAEDRGQRTGDRGAGSAAGSSNGASPKRWQALKLYRIVAVQTAAAETVYELRTQAGARIVWGAAPGNELTDEPSPQQKIAALEHYVADKGPLDRESALPLLDLRKLAGQSKKTAREQTSTTR